MRLGPVRNTTGTHLRDGLLRALNKQFVKEFGARAAAGSGAAVEGGGPGARDAPLSEVDQLVAARIRRSLLDFKTQFPAGAVRVGQTLLLVARRRTARPDDIVLDLHFDGRYVGTVADPWIASRCMETYLSSGDTPGAPSPQLRDRVLTGLTNAATV
ncbi:hypothetical protein CXG81DRAFT_27934 [Caulochytrium protostelioides]|uniref:Chalcone isomerase domain-containing protein n=1 Tax=Caulochytrium protostelioides TaxID=1555241 RepID=A0A4P9X2E3_9FUNG|nr:hypothetical protein CXG81DRAFT_27934 [Caulochytrium protostelioides]|eukprot:RKO99308.1 hypothetical protein CXG81DRAFT_27934 [Caulochytrium protostelioides]